MKLFHFQLLVVDIDDPLCQYARKFFAPNRSNSDPPASQITSIPVEPPTSIGDTSLHSRFNEIFQPQDSSSRSSYSESNVLSKRSTSDTPPVSHADKSSADGFYPSAEHREQNFMHQQQIDVPSLDRSGNFLHHVSSLDSHKSLRLWTPLFITAEIMMSFILIFLFFLIVR